MIEYVTGNLLEAPADALVNTVNTVGVMGKGVALQFKRAFPENYDAYVEAVARHEVEIGRMFVWSSLQMVGPRLVINFPTKKHWKGRSYLKDVEAGLADLRRVLIEHDVESVALPALGCGLGGLSWADVRPRIEAALDDLPIRILVFPPQAAPPAKVMADSTARPNMTPGRASLVALLGRYLAPGERASLLEVQKLLYFLQESGEPLRLRYTKDRFGPYADNIRHVLKKLEGHYLEGFGDGTGHAGIKLLPGAYDEALGFLADKPATGERLDRVIQLIQGFESPYELELLATTHWVVADEGATEYSEAISKVQEWSRRKEQLFTPHHIGAAWNRLHEHGWLPSAPVASAA